jgi:hypothetical protein
MLRWIGRILLITLLVIHLAILLLWWDSWHHSRVTIFPESTQRFGIWSGDGMVIFKEWDAQPFYSDPLCPLNIPSKHFAIETVDLPASPLMPLHGGTSMNPGYRYLRICFPYWFASAVSGVMVWPWIGWTAYRRRRARQWNRAGLCPKCGYDMRANPAKCSECGHEPGSLVRD